MLITANRAISPLLSFDFYLEAYHRLVKTLKKEEDLKHLREVLNGNLGSHIQNLILEENYDTLVVTCPKQHIVWVNDGFTQMTGYTKHFAIGKRPSFLQGKETPKSTTNEIREQLKATNTYSGSVINHRKNGEPYLCKIQILPLYDSQKELTHFIALEKELLAA
ncbi:MAG: PAS domain-containing protein [Allomuricauda sp.]|jgi:PAS domain S-box-containing protein|uniref:PAS domain-containing protein n=1 Tax=Flavobacteriaceae TaxID=49546 RepID=UPI0015CD2440|nr:MULTISPECIES: PAS domain-containing protein [unclassified Allomuricauda]MBO6829495.1 PAS domain-containing protein [Allomuricauda sp.]NYJ26731.1 PAS domain S-box-containing protein [Muricauda sp. ARW1Y1]